ncbi:DDE-type integrase/transposase/recombinase, partial [Streptomyces sp. NPDC001177]
MWRWAGLVVDALRMAAGRGGLKEGCIAHSDRGSEYTSREYRILIMELGLRQSMGRTGTCCDKHLSSHCSSSPIGFTLRSLLLIGGGRGVRL